MSSKSRKQTSKKSAYKSSTADAPEVEVLPAEHHGLDTDEYIKVPTETSKLRFILMIGLVVLLLIIFMVPGAVMGTGSSQSQDVAVTWTHPSKGPIEIGSADFTTDKRRFDAVMRLDIYMPFVLRLEDPSSISDADTLRLIVLDELAQEAGIVVTDAELTEYLREIVTQRMGGDANIFKSYAQRMGGVRIAEETLRRLLRGKRYLDMVGYVAGLPDPDKIEELWGDMHESFAFDYVELEVASLEADALAVLPADTELEGWFDALEEGERAGYMAPERRRAEVVSFRLDGAVAPAALLEAFLPATEIGPDEQAQNYFNRVSFIRFRRPAEELKAPDETEAAETEATEGATEEPEVQEPPPSPYLSFEEAKETCLVEAPVYYAMELWLEKLRSRQVEGEVVDFCTEAALLGLTCRVEPEALALADYGTALEELGGASLAIHVFNTGADQFAFGVQVQEGAISILRVIEQVAPTTLPFAEVRDRVADDWVANHSEELAVERLDAIRTGFAEFTPEEDDETVVPDEDAGPRRSTDEAAFLAAVEAAGMTVQRRDWLDKAARFDADPNADLDAHAFLRAKREYFELAEGEVPTASVDFSGERVYLVRLVGTQDVPLSEMTPGDYTSLKGQSAGAVREGLQQGSFGKDALAEQFDVIWPTRDYDDDEDLSDDDLGDDEKLDDVEDSGETK